MFMRTFGALLCGALLVFAGSTGAGAQGINPQPEPPGKAKIKRIYTGGPDSRRTKTIKQAPAKQVAPTKY